MFKTVKEEVWAYDAEWVPDANAGRALYELPEDMPEAEVIEHMWHQNGATEENPRPFLKLVLCRVVSIAFVRRKRDRYGEITLDLRSRPKTPARLEDCDEAAILGGFLDSVGKVQPQLVGFNSAGSDLRIFIQRSIIHGIQADKFCKRPDKPWEGVDYFARDSEWNVDLINAIGGWGKAQPSLNELARQSGIPCKIGGSDGGSTAPQWLAGDIGGIVKYNEQDALSTFLLWLRTAFFAGHLSAQQYQDEQKLLRKMVEERAAKGDNEHLAEYLEEWDRLKRRPTST
jgi:predicted PolB exonuclease-like 3'-5' exonuclease